MYRNPTFDLDRDQENTAMLIHDLRRVMGIALIVVVGFSILLIASGGVSAGFNLLLIVGAPLAMILATGEVVNRRRRRSTPG